MRTFVKICGLSEPAAIEAAVAAGADAVGFVFADSPRRVSPARAAELAEAVPPGTIRVAVMQHPSPDEVAAVLAAFRPDWLQTDAADFSGFDLPADVRRLPVHRDSAALDEASVAADGLVLYESAASGSGQRADWQRAARLARTTSLVLAGGLTPDNVTFAIEAVRPYGVDVSSGVESRRGVKDPARIAAFVQAVRTMERTDAG